MSPSSTRGFVGLGDYEAEREIDLEGAYLAPGFIDAHVHVESAMVPPGEFARVVAPLGATTIITDPHEIANVLGLEGIRFMFDSAKYGPLSMYVMASSCVPATRMETNGAELHWYDLAPLQSDPWVLGLAEVMNFPGVVAGEPEVLDKLRTFRAPSSTGMRQDSAAEHCKPTSPPASNPTMNARPSRRRGKSCVWA